MTAIKARDRELIQFVVSIGFFLYAITYYIISFVILRLQTMFHSGPFETVYTSYHI